MPSDIPVESLPPASTRLQRLPLLWRAYRRARSLNADLYHIHDPELIPVAFFLRQATGAVIIYDMHEDYRARGRLAGRALRGLERWCFSWVDHVVTAERRYDSIVSGSPAAHTWIANYYKPYSNTTPRPPRSASPPRRFLYTGSIAGHRGLFAMIDLARRIREQDADMSLQLVGICRRLNERRRAEGQIRKHNLEGTIQRVGWAEYVPASAMEPFYEQADVGLALFRPTVNHQKSLLTKFFEYLHFGLPIICTDLPLWRDFIKMHGCGAVVPPGDTAAVWDVLRKWQANPEAYTACVRAAHDAASQYRWQDMGSRLLSLYTHILNGEEPERRR